jgi:hypothetical protein
MLRAFAVGITPYVTGAKTARLQALELREAVSGGTENLRPGGHWLAVPALGFFFANALVDGFHAVESQPAASLPCSSNRWTQLLAHFSLGQKADHS